MEPEPEAETRMLRPPEDDPVKFADRFFTKLYRGGVSERVLAYALVPGERTADYYAFPCRCQPPVQEGCQKCRVQLPDEQVPDGEPPLPCLLR